MTTGYEEQNPIGPAGDSPGSSSVGEPAKVGESAKQEAQNVAEHVRSQAKEAGYKAQERMSSAFEEQKGRMARQATGLASALRKTADDLEGQEQENLAVYLRSAANVSDKVADSIERRDARDLLGSADDLARNQPLMVIAGAAALGFFASRAISAAREGDSQSISTSPTQVVGQGI